jgi:glycosidase
MPIFKSPSYHGYDTQDYETIDPLYGTQADLVELLELCHARGVRVILDLVLNHTSSRHPWFLNASRSADNPYRDFYVWRADNPGWTRPWGNQPVWHRSGEAYYYGIFWEGMPDLNYRNPAVEDEMLRVAAHWVELGVDGYRVDAARYLVEDAQGAQADLPETHAFFQRLRGHLAPSRDVTLVAEAWTEREAVLGYYGDGDEFHAAFDFDLAQNIERSVSVGQASFLRTELGRIQRSGRWEFEATFLSNHDMDRLARRLRRAGAVDSAWGVLLTLPGTPFLYYGDELGMASGSGGGDEAKRTPMAWTSGDYAGFSRNEPWYALSEGYQTRNVETLLADPQSTLRRVQALLRLRKQHAALRTGGALALLTSPDPALYAALRWKDGERFLVAVNLSSQPLDPSALDLTQAGATPSDALEGATSARPVLGDGEAAPLTDPAAFSLGAPLAPGETRVWALE